MSITTKMEDHQEFVRQRIENLRESVNYGTIVQMQTQLRILDCLAEITKELEFFNTNLHRVGEGI